MIVRWFLIGRAAYINYYHLYLITLHVGLLSLISSHALWLQCMNIIIVVHITCKAELTIHEHSFVDFNREVGCTWLWTSHMIDFAVDWILSWDLTFEVSRLLYMSFAASCCGSITWLLFVRFATSCRGSTTWLLLVSFASSCNDLVIWAYTMICHSINAHSHTLF